MFGNASEFLIFVSNNLIDFFEAKNFSVQSIELNKNDVNKASIKYILSKNYPLFVDGTNIEYANQFVPTVGSFVKIVREVEQNNFFVVFIGEIISIISEEYNDTNGIYICSAECEGIESQLKFYNLNNYKFRVNENVVTTINSPPIFFKNKNGDAFGGTDEWYVDDVLEYFNLFENLNGVLNSFGLSTTIFRNENTFNNIFEVLEFIANECGGIFSFEYSQISNSYICQVKDAVFAYGMNLNLNTSENELQIYSREGYHGVDFRFVCPLWVELTSDVYSEWGDSTTINNIKIFLDNYIGEEKKIKNAETNQIITDTKLIPSERTELLRQYYDTIFKEYKLQSIYTLDSSTKINLNDFDFYLYELNFYDPMINKYINLQNNSVLIDRFFSPGGTISIEGNTLKIDLEDPTSLTTNDVSLIDLNTIIGRIRTIDCESITFKGYIVPKTFFNSTYTWLVSSGLNKYLQFDLGNLDEPPTNDDLFFLSQMLKKFFIADGFDFVIRSIDSSNLDYIWQSLFYIENLNDAPSKSFPIRYKCFWDEKTNNYVYELKTKGFDENSTLKFLMNKFFMKKQKTDFNLQKEIVLRSTLNESYYAVSKTSQETRNYLVCGHFSDYLFPDLIVAKPVSLQAVQYLNESSNYQADSTAVDKRKYVSLNETQQITPPYSVEKGIKIQLNTSDPMIVDSTSNSFVKFIDINENGKSWAKI